MRKIVSILLLLVFLFNTIGYKAIFFYLEQKADARIQAKIRTLDEMDRRLIAVKIPINLPYQTDWREFESFDGEMTFKGKTYRYVKRKVMRDTLILLCIDHQEKSQLQKSSADYFKKVNDLTSETNKKPVLKSAKTDYYQQSEKLCLSAPPVLILKINHFNYSSEIANGYPLKVKMPPREHTV
ncbi:hypothetical protein GZH53_09325 [Flavihumibacter sp. R14]|nr:hypothetical protein [Flavihumibacter soli]